MQVETVRIKSDAPETGGFIVINKADLQPEHVLFDDAGKPAAKTDDKPAADKPAANKPAAPRKK